MQRPNVERSTTHRIHVIGKVPHVKNQVVDSFLRLLLESNHGPCVDVAHVAVEGDGRRPRRRGFRCRRKCPEKEQVRHRIRTADVVICNTGRFACTSSLKVILSTAYKIRWEIRVNIQQIFRLVVIHWSMIVQCIAKFGVNVHLPCETTPKLWRKW